MRVKKSKENLEQINHLINQWLEIPLFSRKEREGSPCTTFCHSQHNDSRFKNCFKLKWDVYEKIDKE